jgi:hypothetical protein
MTILVKRKSKVKIALVYLLIPISGCLIFGLICSPLREAVIDDDFSTVWEVKNYLVSGEYVRSHWTAPFTLPQVIYGILISSISKGFLPIEAALRLSNLCFSIVAIVSLFLLSRQSGLNSKTSSICCLQLVASSIYTYLSYLFYSDIPFLAMALLSIVLYNQGFANNKPQFFVFASIFASVGILLRQTGITIPISLIAFFIFRENKKINFVNFIVGLVLPLVCVLYLSRFQLSASTFAHILHNHAQSEYLHSPKIIIFSVFERISLLPIMMTLFATPLSFIGAVCALYHCFNLSNRNQKLAIKRSKNIYFSLFLSCLLILICIVIRLTNHQSLFLPYLQWYYSYDSLHLMMRNSVFSLIILLSSALLLFLFITKYRKINSNFSISILIENLRKFSIIDWFTLFNLLLLMAIFQIGDKYYITLLPWFLIRTCSILRQYIKKYFRIVALLMMTIIISNAVVLDRTYSIAEAEIQSIKLLENSGTSRKDIWYSMSGYENFRAYVKEVGFTPPNIKKGIYYDFFHRWWPDRQKQAPYEIIRVSGNLLQAINGKVINEIKVNDWIGRTTRILTVKKNIL